ncbi:MAG: hypothetical protein H7239_08535 [Flavobacterium sp.]|nr:hypothetical protein [Flavobacterium sp.]
MKPENNGNKTWTNIGKISIVIGIIWVGIQIYNFLKPTYSAVIKGDHFPTLYHQAILDDKKTLNKFNFFCQEFPFEKENIKSNKELDSLINNFSEKNKSNFENYCYFNNRNYNKRSIWTFDINNSGYSPLEELSIELPFNNCEYRIIGPDNKIINGVFSNRILLGNLNPSFNYQVIVWDDFLNDMYDENKCKVHHKYGTFDVSFAYKTYGTVASMLQLASIFYVPLLILIFGILLMFLFYKRIIRQFRVIKK